MANELVSLQWEVRFRKKYVVDAVSGCWNWTGATAGKGYGFIKIPKTRKQEYAHRLSWMIHRGEIPDGKYVLHRCDNPACVNPAHLFIGDAKENSWDMRAKQRHLYGEKNGSHVLMAKDVKEIKKMLAYGVSQARVAKLFGVCQMTVSRIHRGERWAHVK